MIDLGGSKRKKAEAATKRKTGFMEPPMGSQPMLADVSRCYLSKGSKVNFSFFLHKKPTLYRLLQDVAGQLTICRETQYTFVSVSTSAVRLFTRTGAVAHSIGLVSLPPGWYVRLH
jgi:hypothetical protein